jgi:hypothetical protein
MYTDLFNSLHEVMLIRIAQALDLVDDTFIILALDGNRNRELAHDQRVFNAVIFRHGLQVRDLECGGVLVEDIGEILDQESIKPFESVEAKHPVIRELSWGTGRLAEVFRVSRIRGIRGEDGFPERK